MTRKVFCVKLNQELEGLDFPPLSGDLGQKVFNNVSKQAWQDWISFQTMIINENRLNLADDSARKFLIQQLDIYFFSK